MEIVSNEMATFVTHGVLLGGFIRWLFGLDVSIGFTAVVGTVGLAVSPWMTEAIGISAASAVPAPMVGAFLITIVLGIAQLFRSY